MGFSFGNIIKYGLMSNITMMRLIDQNIRIITVDEFFPNMDQHYFVNEKDEIVKKE